MRLGRIELLLIVFLLVGSGWMALQYLPGGQQRACSPVPLSDEVKAYIDGKITSGEGGQCGDLPKVVGRVSELEGKMGELEKFRQLREQVEERRVNLETALKEQRNNHQNFLSTFREAEVNRLRSEIATMCAGITIVPSGSRGSINPGQNRPQAPLNRQNQFRKGVDPGASGNGSVNR